MIKKLEVNRTTEKISSFFVELGVIKIEVSNQNNLRFYNPVTVKNSYLEDDIINLEDFTLIIDGDFAFLENNPDFKLTYINDNLYIKSNVFEGNPYKADLDVFDTNNKKIALFILNEIITLEENKISVIQPKSFNQINENYSPYQNEMKFGGCSFMGTITRTYYGNTRSVAEANATYQRRLASDLNEITESTGVGNTCTPFGGIDSSCALGSDYICVASYSLCCD